jgi:hypothetical protein
MPKPSTITGVTTTVTISQSTTIAAARGQKPA